MEFIDLLLKIKISFLEDIEIELHADGSNTDAPRICCRRRGAWYGADGDQGESSHEVSATTVSEIAELLSTSIPSNPPDQLCGVDGTTFMLRIGRGSAAVEYSWWCEPPREWACLARVSELLLHAVGMASRLGAEPTILRG